MRHLLKITFLLALSLEVQAADLCPKSAEPAGYFCVTPEMAPDSQISLVDFYQIPAVIMGQFKGFLDKLPHPLSLNADWQSPYMGAGISFYQYKYQLMILGGTTRVAGFSKDAYAAVVCHEIGHLIGGAPYQTIENATWSSSEGQADFFASSVCLPEYFKSLGVRVDELPSRIEKAGFEMLSSLAPHSFEVVDLVRYKKNATKVDSTLINHYPSLQCRYETFLDSTKRSACWFKN